MRTPVLGGSIGPETVLCTSVDKYQFGKIVIRLGKTHLFAAGDGSPIQYVTLAGEYEGSGFLVQNAGEYGFFRY